MTIWKIGCIGLTLALSAQTAMARDGKTPFLPRGVSADAPAGYIEMCQRDLALCAFGAPAIDTAELHDAVTRMAHPATMGRSAGLPSQLGSMPTAALTLGQSRAEEGAAPVDPVAQPVTALNDDAIWKLVRKINSSVNQRIIQASDWNTSGVSEKWQRPTFGRYRMGDCEDIAIEKRVQLLAAGVPADKLFFAVVYRAGFGLHTILIARLSDGDHVLDSATSRILMWSNVDYVWLRQQSTENPLHWTSIGSRAA